MKKYLFSALGAALVCGAVTSCASGDKGADNDTVFSAEFTDSFTTAISNDMGATLAQNIKIMEEIQEQEFNRKEFLKGFQMMVGSAHSDEFLEGVNQGSQVAFFIKYLKDNGMEINRDELLRNVRRLVMADSVSAKDADFYKLENERFMNMFNAVLEKREMARIGLPTAGAPAVAIDEVEEVVEDSIAVVEPVAEPVASEPDTIPGK